MKSGLVLVGLLALGGCATMTNGGGETFTSTKAPIDLNECIVAPAPALYASSNMPGGGFRISRPTSGGFKDYIEVMPKGEGSEVTSWGRLGFRIDLRRCI